MKKKMSLLVAACLALTLTACGSKSEGKTFTVGFDAEFPPYGYMDDNGEYVGFDLDLAEEVCKRNGWELVKRPHRLELQGYGAYQRQHRLHLERFYHERQRG